MGTMVVAKDRQFCNMLLVSLGLAVFSALVAGQSTPACRSIPGQADWPAADTWADLNQTLGGRLIKPVLPGAVCHETQPTYDSALCPIVNTAWSNEYLHSEDPVSVEWDNWTNDTCLPNPQLTCSGEGYPVYVINATTPEHVKAGVDFARLHNIRLVIKNSGHDYVGRSVAGNSLSIWVHHMKNMTFNPGPFKPKNCNATIDGASVTALAGSQMEEVYNYTALYNHTVVGGNGRTVALGGFVTGGGHSVLAPHYGLAADQVLEMEVVTPKGEILTLNECQNTDLFWANRGGGGGTFGVLTKATMRTVPSPRVANVNFYITAPIDHPHIFDMAAYVVGQFPRLGDAGVSGYPLVVQNQPNASDLRAPNTSGMMGRLLMLTDELSDLVDLVQPVLEHAEQTWPGFVVTADYIFYDSFHAWFADNYDATDVGYGNVMASHLLDKPALTANATALRNALESFSAGGQATVYIVSGKGVHDAKPRGGSNAVLPAWRRTYVHATASVRIDTKQDPKANTVAIATANAYAQSLRDLSPDTGAYMNEASRFEPGNWQKTFWGDNYERLLAIKREVDPDDVLWCHPCVGNERWEVVDGQLCRVQESQSE